MGAEEDAPVSALVFVAGLMGGGGTGWLCCLMKARVFANWERVYRLSSLLLTLLALSLFCPFT